MAEVVNLRLHRKRKARADREADAATSRAQSGQPKALREAQALERARAAKLLEGHRREAGEGDVEAP